MSKEKLETLSALLDDELSAHKLGHIIKDLNRGSPLRDACKRYRMIGVSLRGEPVNFEAMGVADAVSKRLQDEPTLLAPERRHGGTRWVQPLVGTAVAASVAAVAISVAPIFMGGEGHETVAPAVQIVAQQAPPPVINVSTKSKWKKLQPGVESRLNGFLADHNEFSHRGTLNGIMPYASFVSYDDR